MKNIVILGSTGSIGKNALDIVRRYPKEFRVLGLGANRNFESMVAQIREFWPKAVALQDTSSAEKLKHVMSSWKKKPSVWNHSDGLERLASMEEADLLLCGMVGSKGLKPLVAALKNGKTIGLANKESLIVAGDIIMRLSKKYKAPVIPVDSEHSAIFQIINSQPNTPVRRLILTASGGPFYRYEEDLDKITVQQALKHPTWKMGEKITVDSATLMNKGLEAIEAHFLFGVPMDRISILIHPQSIVHSLVEFEDGAMMAQLSQPDMRLPIQYALTYPKRIATSIKRLELDEVGRLDFAAPDFSRFPCLGLALEAGRQGGTMPVALSSSNEEAVYAFIEGKISFMTISKVVSQVLKKHVTRKKPTLDDVHEVDAWARSAAQDLIQKLRK